MVESWTRNHWVYPEGKRVKPRLSSLKLSLGLVVHKAARRAGLAHQMPSFTVYTLSSFEEWRATRPFFINHSDFRTSISPWMVHSKLTSFVGQLLGMHGCIMACNEEEHWVQREPRPHHHQTSILGGSTGSVDLPAQIGSGSQPPLRTRSVVTGIPADQVLAL